MFVHRKCNSPPTGRIAKQNETVLNAILVYLLFKTPFFVKKKKETEI